jgi:hypothetical protein
VTNAIFAIVIDGRCSPRRLTEIEHWAKTMGSCAVTPPASNVSAVSCDAG